MSTPVPVAPTNLPELVTYRDLALQAATAANLNSFSAAYEPTPTQAERLAAMFNKTYPDTSRLANICDSGLTKQFAIFVEPASSEDPSNSTLAVISCPFPTVISATNEAVFAGTLGDRMDIICPVTIRMRDVRGSVITVSPTDVMPTKLNLAVSTSNPIAEEGPPPDEGIEADQPGPDRIHIDVVDPDDKPCFIRIPKMFPLSGGYSIPTTNGNPTKTLSTTSLKPLFSTNSATQPKHTTQPTDELLFWYEAMRYGIVNLGNYSIHAKDTLFYYETMNKDHFIPETNLTSRFTCSVTYLTPLDAIYDEVTRHVLIEREKATTNYGSRIQSTNNAFTTPPKIFDNHFPNTAPPANISPTNDVRAILEGLTAALTESTSKTMTGTEREQAKEATDVKAFYEILLQPLPNKLTIKAQPTNCFTKLR
jgi:hypothetical protein